MNFSRFDGTGGRTLAGTNSRSRDFKANEKEKTQYILQC